MEKQHNEEAETGKITSPSLGPSGQYINPSAGEQGVGGEIQSNSWKICKPANNQLHKNWLKACETADGFPGTFAPYLELSPTESIESSVGEEE